MKPDKNFGLYGPAPIHIVGDKINEGIAALNRLKYGYIYCVKTEDIIFNKNSSQALNNKTYRKISKHKSVGIKWCEPQASKKQLHTDTSLKNTEYAHGIDFDRKIPF